MKKLLSFTLAIMLIATLSVPAFAATIDSEHPNASVPITGAYQAGSTTAAGTISVDVSWSAMSFTYTGASQGTWNPQDHNYGTGVDASWSTNKGWITVKNHSDVAVTASYEFKAETGLNVTGAFYTKGENDTYTEIAADNQKFDLATAKGTKRNDADASLDTTPKNTIYFGITGGSITEGTTNLGNITVTISTSNSTTPTTPAVDFDADALKNAGTNSDGISAALTTALNAAIQDNKETFTIQMSATYTKSDIERIFDALNGVGSELTNLKLIFKGLTTMPNGLVSDFERRMSLTELSYLSLPDVTKIEDYALGDLYLDTLELTAEGTITLGNNSFGDDKNPAYTLVLNKDKTSEVNGKTWNGYTFDPITFVD